MAQHNSPFSTKVAVAPVDWPWDHLPVEVSQSLALSMAEQFDVGPIYLLIDPMLGPVEQLPPHLERYPIPGDGLGITPDDMPFLVEFETCDDPTLIDSLSWAAAEQLKAIAAGSGAYRLGGWLQPHDTGPAVDLADQIGGLLRAQGGANGGRYLRLADRRVLDLLRHAATPPIDWTAQLQGISNWVYLDRNFKLCSVRGRPGLATTDPLRMSPAHWDLVAQAEAINRSLMAWQRTTHPLPDNAVHQLLPALLRARQQGLQRPDDQAAYAVEAVRYPAFEQWPNLPGRIARSLKTRQPLADRLEALRDQWSDATDNTLRPRPNL